MPETPYFSRMATKRKDRPERLCRCGCGEPIPRARRPQALFVDTAHQRRQHQRRHRARVRGYGYMVWHRSTIPSPGSWRCRILGWSFALWPVGKEWAFGTVESNGSVHELGTTSHRRSAAVWCLHHLHQRSDDPTGRRLSGESAFLEDGVLVIDGAGGTQTKIAPHSPV